MGTNIKIDDKLMSRALRTNGCRTKQAASESGLCPLVQFRSQKKLRTLKGKITWEGDIDKTRKD